MIPLIAKIFFVSTCNIYFFAIKYEIKFPEIVVRQCILETGNGGCTNCSFDGNNCFGFYTDHYLKFKNFSESVKYYKQFQNKYMPKTICTETEYYNWLIDYGYASSKNYVQTLKNIKIKWN